MKMRTFALLIGLAILPSATLADEDKGTGSVYGAAGTGGYAHSSEGGYQHQPKSAVEWAEIRIARLQSYIDAGQVYYGNSKVPLTSAIKQTRRQLAAFLEAERNGTPFAIPGTPGFTGLGNTAIPACTGSLYC